MNILKKVFLSAMVRSFFRKMKGQQLVFQASGENGFYGSKLSLLEYFKKEYP